MMFIGLTEKTLTGTSSVSGAGEDVRGGNHNLSVSAATSRGLPTDREERSIAPCYVSLLCPLATSPCYVPLLCPFAIPMNT